MITGVGSVWFLVPEGVDDPARVSGGNVFDQRVRDELTQRDWTVRMVPIGPDAAVADALAGVPRHGLVMIDGLVAVRAACAIEEAAERLRIVVLAHMVIAGSAGADARAIDGERRALRRAHRVIVTSAWARAELIGRGLVAERRIVVAVPGSDDAPAAARSPSGGSLLCVGVVAPHKGQDMLVDALARLDPGLGWTCTIAGSLETEPEFAARLADQAAHAGLSERITWAGVLTGDELDAAYARADLLVAPSRSESYGMAVSDALRRGIPVIATRVGGLPEAVEPGDAAVLVSPDDPAALSDTLKGWLVDAALRGRLRSAARRLRSGRPRWTDTAETIQATLAGVP